MNYPRSIASVRVACCCASAAARVKVSLRGKGDVDVQPHRGAIRRWRAPQRRRLHGAPAPLAAVTRDVLAAVRAAVRGEPAASIPTRP